MPKAKNKNKGRRTRVSKPVDYNYATPGNTASSVGSVGAPTLLNQVEGIVNPWSMHATGSKVPDDDGAKSVAMTISYPKSFKVDANGFGATYVAPDLNALFTSSSTIDGATQTVTTFGAPISVANYAEISAAFHRYRHVSWGVRVYSTLAPTEQKGSYKIVTMPENPPNGWSWAGGLFEDTVSLPLSEKGIHWISKPIGVNHKEYITPASTAFWTRCVVIVEGAPVSSTAYTIEIVLNLECQINIGSITSVLATPAADNNTLVNSAAASTRAVHGKTHHKPGFMDEIKSFALSSLRKVAVQAIPYVGGAINNLMDRSTGNNPRNLRRIYG